MIAGADWFQGTWLAVIEGEDGRITVRRVAEFSDFLGWENLDLLVIDIPIGLQDRGARSCDAQARKAIGPRGSSVFPAPIRPALNARTHEEACRIWEDLEGKRCSIQAFGIYPMISEIDRSMSPELQERVREGHPELSFAHLNRGSGLEHSKHKPEGRQQRTEILEPHFPELRTHLSEPRHQRGTIDLLDAFAMLWTARRVKRGVAIAIPERAEYDARGLRMEMVA